MNPIENLNDLLDKPIKADTKDTKDTKETKDVKETKEVKEVKEFKTSKTKKVEEKDIYNDDNKLIIGLNDKSKELFIPEKSRFLNTLVIGTKGTGKTTSVLPMFVEQDLKRKNAGVTIISSSKEMSYNIYSLSKKYKRKIHFLKPSINNEVTNKFLWLQDYNYDYINEHIINYKEAIKKKEVVIIDMEVLKYKSDALKAVAMLLLQLRLDIQETDITQRCHHFLYVDDAYNYLKFLEDLLVFSDNYNLGITLFMQSRNQLITKNKDFNGLINNNIRNTLLLNNITPEDYNYYKNKFFEKNNPSEFFNREFNTMLYETIDSMGVRRTGITKFKKLLIGDWEELESKSKRIRSSLLKEKRKERELELRVKYQKSLEVQNKQEDILKEVKDIKDSNSQKTISTLTKEPKPIDNKLIKTLTTNPPNEIEIKINKTQNKDCDIKKEKSKNNQVQLGVKPNFNPPKTNYDLELEQKNSKIGLFDLTKDIDDLGSIKPKNKLEKNEENKSNDNIKNDNIKEIKFDKNKENSNLKEEKINKENIDVKNEEKINPIELQKQKEEETIKLQEVIEKKIQEQIKNEENERKRLVATRIFNNYNENIDYCDEVFDFKYE